MPSPRFSGKHEGKRVAHASGFCVKGSFAPTAEAASLSKAPHLSGKGPWPVIGRFSMGGGNPVAPNADKGNARGIALHFDLGGGNVTDMVMISAPVFVAKTPEKFLDLLQRVASKDQAKIDGFFEENPESKNQKAWLTARPVPASYATVSYYGVHTFTLTNAEGKSQIIKWKFVPKGGEVGLTDDEAKAKDPDFYRPELAERLAKGPAEFELNAILGEPGDATDDPTAFGRRTASPLKSATSPSRHSRTTRHATPAYLTRPMSSTASQARSTTASSSCARRPMRSRSPAAQNEACSARRGQLEFMDAKRAAAIFGSPPQPCHCSATPPQ